MTFGGGLRAGLGRGFVERARVSLMDLFSRRGDGDDVELPQLTDEELLAWGTALTRSPDVPRRRVPLRAAGTTPRRARPLVADPR